MLRELVASTESRESSILRGCRSQVPTLAQIAEKMVSNKRGILAVDESIGTMSTRLESVGVDPTEENRRSYRELLVTTPELSALIHRSGSSVR